MANDIQVYAPGAAVTAQATTAVTRSTFLAITGNRTAGGNVSAGTAGAGVRSFGVAAHDAKSGDLVTVRRAGVVRVTAGAVITAGAEVEVGTAGKAIAKASGTAVGYAVTGAASGALAEIHLYV